VDAERGAIVVSLTPEQPRQAVPAALPAAYNGSASMDIQKRAEPPFPPGMFREQAEYAYGLWVCDNIQPPAALMPWCEWRLEEQRQKNLFFSKAFWRPGQPLPPEAEQWREQIESEYAAEVASTARRQQQAEDARRLRAAQDRKPLKLLTLDEVRALPKPEDLVAGLVPLPVTGTSCIGVVFGQSGAFKSFLALHLGLCVANGQPFLGLPVLRPGASVLVLGEGQGGAGIRADAALDGNRAFLSDRNRVRYIREPFPLDDPAYADEVIGLCRDIPDLRFTWLDSLADFYGEADENSASGMSRVLGNMRRISRELGCTVIGSGHTGHGQRDEDGTEVTKDRQRGTSRFRQAWDFEVQATGTHLISRKERESEPLPPVAYRTEKRLESLAVVSGGGAGRSGQPDEHAWPYPVTAAQLDRVVQAVWDMPGQGVNVISRAAGVRKETAALALVKAIEGGLIENRGREDRPKYHRSGYVDWVYRTFADVQAEAGRQADG
jgi:hypothetical protein